MKLKTQHNKHSDNHVRWGSRGNRLSSKLIRYGQTDTAKAFAEILLEETERYLPVIEENEISKNQKETN